MPRLRLDKNSKSLVIKMARTWLGHIGETVGIGVGIPIAAIVFDSFAGQGSVPYLNNLVHSVKDFSLLAGPAVGLLYFGHGIPRIRQSYRDRELEDIAEETAHFRALRNRECARNRYHGELGGGDHHE